MLLRATQIGKFSLQQLWDRNKNAVNPPMDKPTNSNKLCCLHHGGSHFRSRGYQPPLFSKSHGPSGGIPCVDSRQNNNLIAKETKQKGSVHNERTSVVKKFVRSSHAKGRAPRNKRPGSQIQERVTGLPASSGRPAYFTPVCPVGSCQVSSRNGKLMRSSPHCLNLFVSSPFELGVRCTGCLTM